MCNLYIAMIAYICYHIVVETNHATQEVNKMKVSRFENLRWKFFAWLMCKHPVIFKRIDGKLPISTLPF